MSGKVLVLAGKTLDKVMPAIRSGRIRAKSTGLTSLDPGNCACTASDVRSISLAPLATIVDVTDSNPLHVAVSASELRRDLRGFEFSLFPREFPAGTLWALSPQVLVPSFSRYYVDKARMLDFEEAVLLGMELCGHYAHDVPGNGGSRCEFLVEPALTYDELLEYLDSANGMRGIKAARTAARWVAENSYSPQESILALEQYLMPMRGGRGYPKPQLNPTVSVPPDMRDLVARESFKPDIYWEGLLDLEYDGGYHVDPAQVERDKARAADILALGIPVIQATRQSLSTCADAERLGLQVGKLLESGLGAPMTRKLRRLDDPDLRRARESLHIKFKRIVNPRDFSARDASRRREFDPWDPC